jgi:sulfonate transport system ATP-binding protein
VVLLREGHLGFEVDVPMARPREIGVEFAALRRRLLGELGVEQ